jgi:hypothetical protein
MRSTISVDAPISLTGAAYPLVRRASTLMDSWEAARPETHLISRTPEWPNQPGGRQRLFRQGDSGPDEGRYRPQFAECNRSSPSGRCSRSYRGCILGRAAHWTSSRRWHLGPRSDRRLALRKFVEITGSGARPKRMDCLAKLSPMKPTTHIRLCAEFV